MEDVDPEIVLIRQYRYATGGYIYEVPAGRPDRPGEDWELCARRELEEGTQARDVDEFMDVVRLPFSRVLEMVRDGEIVDAKSICTILYAAGFVFGL